MAEIFPQYTFSSDEYKHDVNLILKVANKINQKATLLSTDYEREKMIHDYLCKNVIYEDIGEESHSIVGPLLKGKGVCDGISKSEYLKLKCNKSMDYYELTGRDFHNFDSLREHIRFCLNRKCDNIQTRVMMTTTKKSWRDCLLKNYCIPILKHHLL